MSHDRLLRSDPVKESAAPRPADETRPRIGVWGRFDASALALPGGPVLLVDDLVDSRWTVTVAARELRRAGAPAVLPFALALRA